MEQFETKIAEDLSERQLMALPHLLKPGPLTEQARNAGVSRTTLYRWLQDDSFRRAVDRLREDSMDLAESHLQAMAYRAAAVIQEALHDDKPEVRFRAAQAVLQHAHNAQYGQHLQRRVELLMDAFDLSKEADWTPR